MNRLNNDWFVNAPYMNLDFIYAVRVMHGKMYLLGFMEDCDTHRIKKAKNTYNCRIDTSLFERISFNQAIRHVRGWDDMSIEYVLNEGICIDDGKDYLNARDMFLNFIEPLGSAYEKTIFLFESTRELGMIADALKDGDYIFIITED